MKSFDEWWDEDSGWGGEHLSEYKLAKEAYQKGVVDGVRESASRLNPEGNTDSLLAKILVKLIPLKPM